jgi:hypothetical protein
MTLTCTIITPFPDVATRSNSSSELLRLQSVFKPRSADSKHSIYYLRSTQWDKEQNRDCCGTCWCPVPMRLLTCSSQHGSLCPSPDDLLGQKCPWGPSAMIDKIWGWTVQLGYVPSSVSEGPWWDWSPVAQVRTCQWMHHLLASLQSCPFPTLSPVFSGITSQLKNSHLNLYPKVFFEGPLGDQLVTMARTRFTPRKPPLRRN